MYAPQPNSNIPERRLDELLEDIMVMYQSLASGFSSVTAKENQIPVPELNMEAPALSMWKFGPSLGS